jgi:hypothetical protein
MLGYSRGMVNDFVSLCNEYSGNSSAANSAVNKPNTSGQRYSPKFRSKPQPQFNPKPSLPRLHPPRLYHGSSLQAVVNIFRTRRFLVGDATPRAFWMADTPQKTLVYCKNDGGILVIDVLSGAPLTNRGGGVYIFEIRGAQPYKKYYQIPSLVPVAILDPSAITRNM